MMFICDIAEGLEALSKNNSNGETWINNVAHGATCKAFEPNEEMKKLAIKSSDALWMNYSGVDIMLFEKGYTVTEVNSIPAWKGLQSVCKDKNVAEEMIKDFILSLIHISEPTRPY